MRVVIPMILLAVTLALIAVGPLFPGRFSGTVGIASGSPLAGLASAADTPEQAMTNFLSAVQKRDWGGAYAWLSPASGRSVTRENLMRELAGSDGSLRSFSSLANWELRPLHATTQDAQLRTTFHWSTPVGPVEEVRDLKLTRDNSGWRIVWPAANFPEIPAQVIPVNYLRWDLVTSTGPDSWGQRSVDSPRVRILSMNPVEFDGAAVVMGEVVNEDTIPAFVNVNATLIDGAGKAIDEESSFDKISHVLLPKQISPYRIDFPGIGLEQVKSVHMDIKSTLVPASADPVIGVMNQKLEKNAEGESELSGELLNQSGQVVNIPHVIATFYDNGGKVIWVSDGYVERALLPGAPESFAVEIPGKIGEAVHSYHVVVNHYNLSSS